jgi:hypothetical protein
MQLSKLLIYLFFLCGIVLLGVMIQQVGLAGLIESFHAIGLWIIPFLLLKSVSVLLHTAGWMACFPGHRLHLRFWRLLLVSRAGALIEQTTPTATVGGEVVKVLLLESLLSRDQVIASVMIDKASITIAKMFYLALGMLYLAQYLSLPAELQLSLTLTIGLISLVLVGFVALQRYGLLSKCVQWLGLLRIGQERLLRLGKHLASLDTQLMTYHSAYPWRFVRSLLLHFMGYGFHVIKTYILLNLLLGSAAPGFVQAIMVSVAVDALDQIFFFVPGRIGTLEGARFMVLSALGVAQIYGLAFGLVARVEQLVWSGLGVLAYAYCSRISPLPTARSEVH